MTLCVDTTELPKTKKVPKDADEETKEKIREQNDEIRKVITSRRQANELH